MPLKRLMEKRWILAADTILIHKVSLLRSERDTSEKKSSVSTL